MIVDIVMAVLGSGPIGALIGGVLGYYNRKTDLELKRLDLEQEKARWGHEVNLRQMDLEQVKAEAAGKREVAQIEGEATAEAARMNAVAAAQAADRVNVDVFKAAGKWGRGVLVLVSALQSLVRPVLTVLLVGTALWLNVELLMLLRGKTWAALSAIEQRDLALEALRWTLTQATVCVSYWMVSRGTGK